MFKMEIHQGIVFMTFRGYRDCLKYSGGTYPHFLMMIPFYDRNDPSQMPHTVIDGPRREHWETVWSLGETNVTSIHITGWRDILDWSWTCGRHFKYSITLTPISGSGSAAKGVSGPRGTADDLTNNESKKIVLRNHPNPFNPVTNINFSLPQSSDVTITIDVFNILGQRVETLVNGNLSAGEHTVTWDGSRYSSGIYFYRLSTGEIIETRKMLLLK